MWLFFNIGLHGLFSFGVNAKSKWHTKDCDNKTRSYCTWREAEKFCSSIKQWHRLSLWSPSGIQFYKDRISKDNEADNFWTRSRLNCYHGPIDSVDLNDEQHSSVMHVSRKLTRVNYQKEKRTLLRLACFDAAEQRLQLRDYETIPSSCEALAGKYAANVNKLTCQKQLSDWCAMKWMRSLFTRYAKWSSRDWNRACQSRCDGRESLGRFALAALKLLVCILDNNCQTRTPDPYAKR